MTARSLFHGLIPSLLIALLAACGGGTDPQDDGPDSNAEVASVGVTPATGELVEGKTLQLKATPKTAGGKAIPGKQVAWSSSDEVVATVDAAGLVTGKLPGDVRIRATIEGQFAEATIDVQRAVVASVEILPGSNHTSVGREFQLTATAKDADGAVLGARNVSWSSSASDIVSVDESGLAHAHAVGAATITATIDAATGTLDLDVQEPVVDRIEIVPGTFDVIEAQTTQLEAKVYDVDGFEVEWPVEWDSDDERYATVDSSGLVTGGKAGTARIRASADGNVAAANGTVTAGVVAGVRIIGSELNVPIGETSRIYANAVDALSNPLDRPLTWEVSDPAVATVDGAGNVSGLTLGETVLTARFSDTVAASVTLKSIVKVIRVSAGKSHSCALTPNGRAICFGSNTLKQIGNDAIGIKTDTPAAVQMSPDLKFTELSAGDDHTCALTFSGDVWCWGNNSFGQLGSGSSAATSASPVKVQRPAGVKFVQLALGGEHSCAIAEGTEEAYCWGRGDDGRLGSSVTGAVTIPTTVSGGHRFAQLSAGSEHTCGIADGGKPYCWGKNSKNQVAPTGVSSNFPVEVETNSFKFLSIAAGVDHTCGIREGGLARCWGGNGSGQLGNGATSNAEASMVIVAKNIQYTKLIAGRSFTCGVTGSENVYCWGANAFGQLGRNAESPETLQPDQVSSSVNFRSLSARESHVCGMTPAPDRGYCWGRGDTGQLGRALVSPVPGRIDGQN